MTQVMGVVDVAIHPSRVVVYKLMQLKINCIIPVVYFLVLHGMNIMVTNWNQEVVMIALVFMLSVNCTCRARIVQQGSILAQQEQMLWTARHASPVLETRTLRRGAQLYNTVSATQVPLGRMGAIAETVWQASTRRPLERVIARIVVQGNTLQPSEQHQTHVATVRRIHTHLRAVGLRPAVNATQDTLDRMGDPAQLVCQASTRQTQETPNVHHVKQASIPMHQRFCYARHVVPDTTKGL
jgi:hypothetical protein